MKRFIVLALLVAVFGVFDTVQAQFRSSGFAWGLSLGGAQGNNDGGDRWVMQYRGYLQHDVIPSLLIGQVGVGYTLRACILQQQVWLIFDCSLPLSLCRT
jgi:hypothetical protein